MLPIESLDPVGIGQPGSEPLAVPMCKALLDLVREDIGVFRTPLEDSCHSKLNISVPWPVPCVTGLVRVLGITETCDLGSMYRRLLRDGHQVRVSVSEALASGTMAGMVPRSTDWRVGVLK